MIVVLSAAAATAGLIVVAFPANAIVKIPAVLVVVLSLINIIVVMTNDNYRDR